MWKEDGRGRPLIPKGEPPTLQVRPPWDHVLVGRYIDKEVNIEDAHDAPPPPEDMHIHGPAKT